MWRDATDHRSLETDWKLKLKKLKRPKTTNETRIDIDTDNDNDNDNDKRVRNTEILNFTFSLSPSHDVERKMPFRAYIPPHGTQNRYVTLGTLLTFTFTFTLHTAHCTLHSTRQTQKRERTAEWIGWGCGWHHSAEVNWKVNGERTELNSEIESWVDQRQRTTHIYHLILKSEPSTIE